VRHAFSLVELSIVLVILGLLTGGILAGQSLIRAAELRSISSDYQRYATSIGTFRDKYMALPGDMTNATSFWGAGTCPGTSANTATAQTTTCNGDGDGVIEQAEASTSTSNGLYRFWQHLANAGLIEGAYTGVSNNAAYNTTYSNIGLNVPAGRISNSGWTMYPLGVIAISDTSYFEGSYGNNFVFGGGQTSGITNIANLKPEEAWSIDTKLDDGKPAVGNVLTFESQGGATSAACSDLAASNASSRAASVYALSNTSINCTLILKSGY